jgi:hypothetical protein
MVARWAYLRPGYVNGSSPKPLAPKLEQMGKGDSMKMTKAQAGALGGKSTARKYGRSYMADLARKGALAFHRKYKLVKIGTSDFSIVDRATGIATGKTINGLELR